MINNTTAYITYENRLANEGKLDLYNELIESGKSQLDALAISLSNGHFQSFIEVLDKISYYDEIIDIRKEEGKRTKFLKYLRQDLINTYAI